MTMHYTHDEAERLAYLAGDTERAELHGTLGDAEMILEACDGEDPKEIMASLERADHEVIRLDEENDELRSELEDLRAELADLRASMEDQS